MYITSKQVINKKVHEVGMYAYNKWKYEKKHTPESNARICNILSALDMIIEN